VTDQLSSDEGLQRQRAVGGFCFQSVLGDDTFLGGMDGVADGQRVLGEVDCRPLQPDHLASSESVVSGKENWDIDLVILDQLEQLLHFLGVVVGGDELLLSRSIGLVNGVARYDPPLHRILERLMKHAVVALTGGALQPCVTKVGVEFVDLITRQVLDGKVKGREEFADAPVDIPLVLVVGLPLDVVLMSLQPFVKVLSENNKSSNTLLHKTTRDINLRLRFLIMKRDNFKCCICGRSPATTPNLELHIDHIKPWSKGGETVPENLQTLCSDCNLGKSDIE